MKLKIMFAALAALAYAPPAMAQVLSADQVTGQPGAVQGTASDGKRVELPVYVPVRADGTVIDPSSASAPTGASANQVQGNVASGANDTGNPIKTGCIGSGSAPSPVATGQRVNSWCTVNGAYIAAVGGLSFNIGDNLGLGNGAFTGIMDAGGNGKALLVAGLNYDGANYNRIRGDTSGSYVVEVASPSSNAGVASVASTAVTGGQVIKASAGNLYGFNVVSGASAGYVLVFNSATVPADGAVTPSRCLPLAANTGLDVNLRGQPAYFSTGIAIAFSTTGCFNKTASATAFIAGDAK